MSVARRLQAEGRWMGRARLPGRLGGLAREIEGKARASAGDVLDALHNNIVDYLERISDPDKVRLSKRWDRDKDYQTYGLSASDYTALYPRFNPRLNALTHDQRLRPADRRARTNNATRSIQRPRLYDTGSPD